MKDFMNKVRNIRGHLQDKESKFIFDNRLLFGLTGDYKYIENIISTLPQKIELDKAVDKCKQLIDQLVIYGAGNDLLILSALYPDFKFRYLCDKDEQKQKNGWNGIPVMSPEKLIEQKDMYVAVNTSAYEKEIVEYLLDNGFAKEKIINLGVITDSLYSAQYFDDDIMSPEEDEVFIDGGCYNCSTDEAFIKWCGGNYKRIYAFEPDANNYEKCLMTSNKKNIKNINIYNKGLWDCETELSFEAGGGAGLQNR